MNVGDSPLEIAWHQRWIVLAVFAMFVVSTYAVSKSLPRTYKASSTLLIVQGGDQQTFDAVQSAQVLARTFGDLIASDNVAALVARKLGPAERGLDIESAMSFEPVAETQLLRITSEDDDPARAQRLANTYAQVFTEYARQRLVRVTQANVEVADAAALPQDPIRPRPALYTLVGGLLGLLAGLGIVFARDRLQERAHFVGDVTARFGIPLLGRIPRVRRGAFGSLAAREPFRLLRTNLRLVGEDGASAAVAITSATGGAGRTTTAVNLGLVLAESGIRVLIVQADAKSPLDSAAAGVLRPEVRKNGGGLRQYLLGAATLEETILTTAHPDVACLPLDGAEGPPPDSVPHGLSWLIETPAGRRLTVDLRRHADVVLLDCPPIHEADAALIAARADGVILVVDARHADKPAIGDAIRQLKVIEARILGIVLNRVQHVGKRRLIARSTST